MHQVPPDSSNWRNVLVVNILTTVAHDDSIPIFDNPNLHTVVWSPDGDLCAPYRCSMYIRCPPTGWRCFIGVVACTIVALSRCCITCVYHCGGVTCAYLFTNSVSRSHTYHPYSTQTCHLLSRDATCCPLTHLQGGCFRTSGLFQGPFTSPTRPPRGS